MWCRCQRAHSLSYWPDRLFRLRQSASRSVRPIACWSSARPGSASAQLIGSLIVLQSVSSSGHLPVAQTGRQTVPGSGCQSPQHSPHQAARASIAPATRASVNSRPSRPKRLAVWASKPIAASAQDWQAEAQKAPQYLSFRSRRPGAWKTQSPQLDQVQRSALLSTPQSGPHSWQRAASYPSHLSGSPPKLEFVWCSAQKSGFQK